MNYDFRPYLIGPQDSAFISVAPTLYIDNYMVGGLGAEHRKLRCKNYVPLNAGIEHVANGIVITDREIEPQYLSYLEDLDLFDPTTVEILKVIGTAPTMIMRILDSTAMVEYLRKRINEVKIRYVDTFGISEVIGRIDSNRSHLRLCEALGLPLYYNPVVADTVRRKSVARTLMQDWIEEDEFGDQVFVATGLNDLQLHRNDTALLRQFLAKSRSSSIVVKKDIATFNKGNRIIPLATFEEMGSGRNFNPWQLIRDECEFLNEDTDFCIEEFVPHTSAPSVLIEIKPDGQVYVKSIQEQMYEGGRLYGFKCPTDCTPHVQASLRNVSQTIGEKLYRLGYIGHAVPDFLIADNDKLCFLEVNMRRGGSSVGENIARRLTNSRFGNTAYMTRLIRCRQGAAWQQVLDALVAHHYDSERGLGTVVAEAGRFGETGFCTLVTLKQHKDTGGDAAIIDLATEAYRAVENLLHSPPK